MKITRLLAILVPLFGAYLPLIAHAQGDPGLVAEIILFVHESILLLLPIAITLAVLAFFWGLAKFILNSGNERTAADGKRIMVWGIIGLFVALSIWGIVGLIAEITGIGQGGTAPIPGVDTPFGPGTGSGPLFDILFDVGELLPLLLPVATLLALLFFFWGVAKMIFNAGDQAAVTAGKRHMVWGVIALFVIVSIWGIVFFLGDFFGVELGSECNPPEIGQDSVISCF
jgi:hypothetical protein